MQASYAYGETILNNNGVFSAKRPFFQADLDMSDTEKSRIVCVHLAILVFAKSST